MGRRRILFFGEAVTLAHVARSLVLAEAVADSHAITLALAPDSHRFLTPTAGVRIEPLSTISGARFLDALRRGKPVYDEATLARYVEDDLDLIDRIRPDLVVGDFRLSLSVSARLRQIPFLTVTNAYWSPWYRRPALLPVLPWTGSVPLALAEPAFALVRRPAMAAHARPLNRVRSRHGLPSLGHDLRRTYTDADFVAYADIPELFPIPGAPASHRHIGPILWSPSIAPPAWWGEETASPSAYVTMGSSGNPALVSGIVAALDSLGVTSLVAAAGASFTPAAGSRARVAAYLPGVEAAHRADLVVFNGGSLTSQQALAAGKPVLGIASNMDQFFNMRALVEAGAGLCLRADRATPRSIESAARRLLGEPGFGANARRLSGILARYSAARLFADMVDGILEDSFDRGSAT